MAIVAVLSFWLGPVAGSDGPTAGGAVVVVTTGPDTASVVVGANVVGGAVVEVAAIVVVVVVVEVVVVGAATVNVKLAHRACGSHETDPCGTRGPANPCGLANCGAAVPVYVPGISGAVKPAVAVPGPSSGASQRIDTV
jgi:hypothetical protein